MSGYKEKIIGYCSFHQIKNIPKLSKKEKEIAFKISGHDYDFIYTSKTKMFPRKKMMELKYAVKTNNKK